MSDILGLTLGHVPNGTKKFLCVREGGVNRSGSLAWQLKARGIDAIAVGWRFVSPETLKMMAGWADCLVCMQEEFVDRIEPHLDPTQLSKVRVVDVGPDVYGAPLHGGLSQYLSGIVDQWKANGYKL